MSNQSPFSLLATPITLPIGTIALAIGIFILDTLTDVEVAVGVLYIPVVLVAARIFKTRGIVLVALGCAALALLGHFISPGNPWSTTAILDRLLGLVALGFTTFLVAKNRSAEEALAERAKLLDLTHDTIFVRDTKDIITYWNRGAQEMYGWTQAEVLGKVTHNLLHTIFPEPLEQINATLLRTDRWDGELVHSKRDGTQVVVASRWSVQHDQQGRPIGTLETNNDITERKRAEEYLQRQATLLDQTHDAIIVWKFSGEIIYWNRGAERLYGYTAEEATGRSSHDLLRTEHPMPAELFEATIERDETWLGELRQTTRDGRKVVVDSRHVLVRAPDGQRLVIETNRDVTERRRAEGALRRSEAHLAEAQALSKTGSFSWVPNAGPTEEQLYMSDEWFRIRGYDRRIPMTPEVMFERIHPDDRERVQEVFNRTLAEGRGFDIEFRLALPDGSVKYLHSVARAPRGTSRQEIVGAVMDVTATKRAMEQLQHAQAELARITRLTTMGQLAASIAHEINQPLTGVVTNAHTALHWLDAEHLDLDKTRMAAERIVRDGQRASDVIGRIRGMMTKSTPQVAKVDINGVIDEVLALTETELRMHSVVTFTELAPKLAPVSGDRVQLQQVILNLVLNAIDAMASFSGRPRVLRIGSQLQTGGEVLISVRDSGPGLDPETAEKIFSPFFTTKEKGIGMGLSICRSIVEAHGGRLWTEPGAPHGAIFQFTMLPEASGRV